MGNLESDVVDALNAVLEDERACVEIAVALTNGATELQEQLSFTEMGTAQVVSCCALRERLDAADVPVSMRINGAVWRVLGAETYDERLLAFAQHQAAIRDGASDLLGWITDRESNRIVQELVDTHAHWVGWLEHRAQRFAASRELDLLSPKARGLHAVEYATPDGWKQGEDPSQAAQSEQAHTGLPPDDQSSAANDEQDAHAEPGDMPPDER